MSIVLQVLIATALIAAFILLRMFSDRSALKQRLRGAHSDCEQTGCFRGCDAGKPTPEGDSFADNPTKGA